MRTSVGFTSPSTTTTSSSSTTTHPIPASHSPWHSPVPYLFGGLAAMLGLIAFALLILACSYWKLSGYLNSEDNDSENTGGSSGDASKEADCKSGVGPVIYEERIVVIMAGDEKPTFLATPITSRAASFAHSSSSKSTGDSEEAVRNIDEEKKLQVHHQQGEEEEEEEEEERSRDEQSNPPNSIRACNLQQETRPDSGNW